MANGKSTWKYNKLLTGRRNYFLPGGPILRSNIPPTDLGKGITSAVGSAVGSIGGGLISNGMTSTAGNVIGGLQNIAGAIPGPWGAVTSAGLGVIGGLANRMFGSKMNKENIAKVEGNINQLNNFSSNASSYDTLASSWGNAPVGMNFDNSYIGKDGWFSHKAKNKANELRNQVTSGNLWVQNSLMNNANNLREDRMNNMAANYSAFGGPLFAMGGKFSTSGGEFTNGLTYIGNGGSHETNPLQGVPMGVDPEGNPNLVEEGETIFNDYVFSKRLKVPKEVRNKYKMRGNKDLSFADMSKELAKESDERPNDPISINGLKAIMGDLAQSQEAIRAMEEGDNTQFAYGGRLFAGGGFRNYGYNDVYGGIDPSDSKQLTNKKLQTLYSSDSPYLERAVFIANILRKKYEDKSYKYSPQESYYLKQVFPDQDIDELSYDKLVGDSLKYTAEGITYNSKASKKGELFPSSTKSITNSAFYNLGSISPIKEQQVNNYKEYGTGKVIPGYFEGVNENGQTYFQANPDWELVNNEGVKRDPTFKDGVTTIPTDYFLRKKQSNAGLKDRYFLEGDDGNYAIIEGDNPALTLQNSGPTYQVNDVPNSLDGRDLYYKKGEKPGRKPLPTWSRYIPAVGLGIGSVTDAMGLTNKPDYSNADAILAASAGAGTYQPVRYDPIGNYLTYRPFDREFALNQMNATAGATRRNLVNTAGGNRSTAMAGLLASDNNYLNQVGAMAKQAEEFNRAQRKEIEDFNRATNSTNSQGFLTADTTNQNALSSLRDFRLRGMASAADIRQKEKLAADQARSANLSGFLTSLGNIGRENMMWNWRNFGLDTGSFGAIRDDYAKLLGWDQTPQKAHGGNLYKKKKGLTY